MRDYKKDFPIFSDKKNKGLIYFDNAATAQRPKKVLDALESFYKSDNANPLRGLYGLSVREPQLQSLSERPKPKKLFLQGTQANRSTWSPTLTRWTTCARETK